MCFYSISCRPLSFAYSCLPWDVCSASHCVRTSSPLLLQILIRTIPMSLWLHYLLRSRNLAGGSRTAEARFQIAGFPVTFVLLNSLLLTLLLLNSPLLVSPHYTHPCTSCTSLITDLRFVILSQSQILQTSAVCATPFCPSNCLHNIHRNICGCTNCSPPLNRSSCCIDLNS